MFLKKEGIFHKIYTSGNGDKILNLYKLKTYPYNINVTDMSITYTRRILGGRYNNTESLIYSQLWRGFALEHLDKLRAVSPDRVDRIKKSLISSLRVNYSHDERIKKILEKWATY